MEKGQIWKMEDDTHLQIVLVGKHLAHYKHFKTQKRVPTMLKAIHEVQAYLKSHGGVLIESALSK